jgi:DNA repair exonuclease SbcCD ATPase subunit
VVPAGLDAAGREARLLAVRLAHDAQGPVLERMQAVAAELARDPMMIQRDVTLFAGLSQQLSALHKKGQPLLERARQAADAGTLSVEGLQQVADHAATTEDALEKGLLRMEDLLTAQRMAAVQDTVEDIQALKERLRDLLEKYRETQDPEVKKAIKREIQRLRQRLGELMQRMQSQMQELPSEHMNAEALKQAELESDAKKLADSFESIEDMLDKNDIDGALKALDEMTSSLDSLTKDMKDQFGASQPEGLSELDQEMSKLMDSANELSDMQKKVEDQTQKVQQELQQKKRERVEQQLEGFTEQMEQKIAEQERALDELAAQELPAHHRASVDELKKELRTLRQDLAQKDIESSLDRARKTQEELEQLRFSMQLGHRYLPRGSEQAQQNQENIKKAGEMAQRGERMVKDLQQMMEQAQQMMDMQGDPRMQELGKQQRQVNERAKQLGEQIGEAGKKFPSLDQQIKPGMERAQQAMQEAEDGLGKGRVQRALDEERRALDELRQVKESMRQALEKQRTRQDGQNGRPQPRDKVAIPGKDTNAAGDALRKQVQRGMKEERLGDYKSDIESYYKSLLE